MSKSMPKPTVCGVRVATWGAESGGAFGLKHHIDQMLFGGNCGHAAISLTLPVTDENTALILKYCSHPPIPIEKQLVSVPQSKQDENGKWVPDLTRPPAFQEEVYHVTFSWWPGTGGYFLTPSINADGHSEREGVNHEWDPNFREFVGVEERVHAGKLSRQKMTYAPLNIIHERSLDDTSEQRKFLNLKAQSSMLENVLESLDVAKDKIKTKRNAFEDLASNRETVANKASIVKSKQEDIQLLTKAKEALLKNALPELTKTEKKRLEKLHPQWKDYLTKSKNKAYEDELSNDFNRRIEGINKAIKTVNDMSDTKLNEEENRLSRPSETEMILFDRFVPNWRTEYGFDKNNKLSEDNYDVIYDKIKNTILAKQNELKQVKKDLKALSYLNYPEHLREHKQVLDLAPKEIEKIMDEKVDLQKEIDNLMGLEEYKKLRDFFYNEYLDEDGDNHLEDDADTVKIKGKMQKHLDKFTAVTGIDWKDIVVIEKNKTVQRISKEELNEIDDILFDHIEKARALAFFDQFSNLKDDDVLQIDEEVESYLYYSQRYSGHIWQDYVAKESEITGKELRELIEAAKSYELRTEEKAEDIQDFVEDNNERIKEINLRLYELKAKKQDLEERQKKLGEDPAYIKYQEYKEIENAHLWVTSAFDMIKDEILDLKENKENSLELYQELQDELDGAYDELVEGHEKRNWREHFFGTPVPDPLEATIAKLKEINLDLAERAKVLNEKLLKEMPTRDCFQAQDFESFLTMGLPPEAEYSLRLDKDSAPDQGIEGGMNVEGMLKQMHQILVEDIPFDLNVNNCSVSAGRILEAGVKDENLKAKFSERVLGAIATPQLIANNTEEYLREVRNSPKDNILKRIGRWNPIQKFMGKQVHALISGDRTPEQKRAAWAKLAGVVIVTSPISLIKGLLTPTETMRKCAGLMKFASEKNHLGFKAAAYAIGGLGMAVFAAPALVENIIKAPFRLVGKIIDVVRKSALRKDKEVVELSPEEVKIRDKKEKAFKAEVKLIEKNTIKITSKDPLKALEMAEKVMAKDKIPMFEPKTRQSIENYIDKIQDVTEKAKVKQHYSDIVNYASVKVVKIHDTAEQLKHKNESTDKRATAVVSLKDSHKESSPKIEQPPSVGNKVEPPKDKYKI